MLHHIKYSININKLVRSESNQTDKIHTCKSACPSHRLDRTLQNKLHIHRKEHHLSRCKCSPWQDRLYHHMGYQIFLSDAECMLFSLFYQRNIVEILQMATCNIKMNRNEYIQPTSNEVEYKWCRVQKHDDHIT